MQFFFFAAVAAASAVAPPAPAALHAQSELAHRALPDSPSGGYAPKVVDCPTSRPKIRSAGDGLSPEESKWLELRRNATIKPMTDLLKRASIKDFNSDDFMSKAQKNISDLPNVAIAVSGGGYRALMNGAGFLAAADDRTPNSIDKGGIGGLLQSATYLSGLSGGGWLVGSIYSNNFSTVGALQSNPRIWKFDRSIFQGPENIKSHRRRSLSTIANAADYLSALMSQVESKEDAGFNATLTDYWGRALAYQLIDDKDGGSAYTFSSIAQTDSFKKGENPMPIIVADGRAPGTKIISLNSTVFEFNPFELGTWDPTAYGFVPLQYLGSNFSNGVVPDGSGKCVRGFDSASFVMGTSSSLFNQFLLRNITAAGSGVPEYVLKVITAIAQKLGEENSDIAQYRPNPFLGYHNDTAGGLASADELDLVDGGSDNQNLPLQPLIQPARKVDVIFAVDSSADTKFNWPDGAAVRATYERSREKIGNGTLFPAVPDQATFISQGLNGRPTFFGCDAANFTLRAGQPVPPLVIYIPNAPYTVMPNVSTFTPSYHPSQRDDIIRNAYNGATQGNGTLDADWPACVACAVLQRSLLRAGADLPAQCKSCFSRYCWDGKTVGTASAGGNNTNPDLYQPAFKISNQTSPSSGNNADGKKNAAAPLGSGLALAGSMAAIAALASLC